jgi:hypothetical protein
VVGTGDVDGGLHDILRLRSGGGQRRHQVRNDLIGLRRGIVRTHELTGRVQRDRSCREDERGTMRDRDVRVAGRRSQAGNVPQLDAHGRTVAAESACVPLALADTLR